MANDIITTTKTEITKSAVDEFITPILKKLKKSVKFNYHDYLVPRGEHFQKYINEAYKEYSTISTLVFHDRIKSLKDIYLPLTLINKNEKEKIVVEGIPVTLLQRCRKLLIIDTAGMGKSTMLKRMFIDVCDKGLNIVGIPLFIDLRRLKIGWSIIDEIEQRLNSLSEKFDKELLLHFLQQGGFIFFLDGYDEISLNDKNAVTQDLQDFVKKAGDNGYRENYFIITSRPEPALSFNGFETYNNKQLDKEEAYILLEKYDTNENKDKSKRLIRMLKTKEYESATEFLKSPLLTSLLFNAFDYKEAIPLKKHLFYRQVYDAYFESHDLKKGDSYTHDKSSGLDTDDFGRVLKYIGFHSLKGGIEYSKDEILGILDKAKTYYSFFSFKSSDFLKDIITAVPLFCKEGGYKWAHKSLMEYFAARFIAEDAKEMQNRILENIYYSKHIEKYINMLDLYCEIDPKGFHKNIRYQFCKDFVSYYDSINYKSKTITNELIDERLSKLFSGRFAIIRFKDKDVGFDYFIKAEDDRIGFLKKFFNDYDELEASGYIFKGPVYYPQCETMLMCFYSNYELLLKLLYAHSKNIFKVKDENFKSEELNKLICKYVGVDKVYRIVINTGASSKQWYKILNSLITNHSRFLLGKNSYLNYDACKKVVEEYDNSLKRDDIDRELFDGL